MSSVPSRFSVRRQWRLVHWEYWPSAVVYAPIFIYWLYLCAKARSFFFFFASNPGIPFGGWDQESKYEIYQRMKGFAFPTTIFVPKHSTPQEIQSIVEQRKLHWPLYAKPDIGGMGKGVQLVHTLQEMVHLALRYPINYILQTPCAGTEELGIFYVRHPTEDRGMITGIVHKQKLVLTGDGVSNLYQLALADRRARLQLHWVFTQEHLNPLEVPTKGQLRTLSAIGNHARGSKFVDISKSTTTALRDSVEKIAKQMPDFCFGRLDVMVHSVQDALDGGPLHLIELNGAGSEPTHMYDPSNSILDAWRQILKHWRLLYKVSAANKHRGYPYGTFSQGNAMLRASKAHNAIFDLKLKPK
jgi:hypothetical protein